MQTFTPIQYLKIDIANSYGLSKVSWNERLTWFDQNEAQLDSMIEQAKEPALFYAGIKAYRDVLAGKPIGYMVSLDATSSGLQLLAALTSDPHAAALCNVINTGTREDAYKNVFNFMKQITGSSAKIDEDDVKQAVMTAFYASKAVPKQVFGEGQLLDIFYGTLEKLAPAAWELNEAMLSLWNPNALEHSWIMPDNFHVRVKVMQQVKERVHFLGEPYDVFYKVNAPTDEGRSLGANNIHSVDALIVRELTRRCDYDPHHIRQVVQLMTEGNFGKPTDSPANTDMVMTLWNRYMSSGYLSARILDYLDENTLPLVNLKVIEELIDSMPMKPFKVISIHDCFRCLPQYANDLRQQYNLQLQLIARSNLLQDIISQLVGKPVTIGKLDPSLWKEIASTNYALS